jgi:transposase
MPRGRPPYDPEFRRRIVELARSGRSPEDLAKEFEPSAHAIRLWVKQADIDEGRREGLTREEKSELTKLRRENARLREERDILKKAAAWFAQESVQKKRSDS